MNTIQNPPPSRRVPLTSSLLMALTYNNDNLELSASADGSVQIVEPSRPPTKAQKDVLSRRVFKQTTPADGNMSFKSLTKMSPYWSPPPAGDVSAANLPLRSKDQIAAVAHMIGLTRHTLMPKLANLIHNSTSFEALHASRVHEPLLQQLHAFDFAQRLLAPTVLGTLEDPILVGFILKTEITKLNDHPYAVLFSKARSSSKSKHRDKCTSITTTYKCKRRSRNDKARASITTAPAHSVQDGNKGISQQVNTKTNTPADTDGTSDNSTDEGSDNDMNNDNDDDDESDNTDSTKSKEKKPRRRFTRNRADCQSSIYVVIPREGQYGHISWRVQHTRLLSIDDFTQGSMAQLLLNFLDSRFPASCSVKEVRMKLDEQYAIWISHSHKDFNPTSIIDPRFYPTRATIANWVLKHNSDMHYDSNDAMAVQAMIAERIAQQQSLPDDQRDVLLFKPPSAHKALDTYLIIQTARMREHLLKYAQQVFFLDSTHGLSRYGYSVFLLMGQDNSRKGQIVSVFILPQETKESITQVLRVSYEYQMEMRNGICDVI